MDRQSKNDNGQLDPVFVHALRETKLLLLVFLLFMLWTVGYSTFAAFDIPTDKPLAKVFGMPAWVAWGVLIPWLVADTFIIWFCLTLMAADPLGEDDNTESTKDMA